MKKIYLNKMILSILVLLFSIIIGCEEAKESEEVVEEPKEKAPTRMLVAAGGKEWYVDADGNIIED